MRNLLLMLVLFTSVITQAQNVAINNNGSLPDNSAILDIKSSTKGLLIPRMNSAAIIAITNPAKGLLVLDTVKNQLLVNMGTPALPNWQTIVASSGWSLTGNAGIDPNTQFIGTLDAKPFIIRVNNVRSGYIDSNTLNASYGFRSLFANTTGIQNTGMGMGSMQSNTTGSNNTGTGGYSMYNNTTGNENSAYGNSSLMYNETGNGNTSLGTFSMFSNSSGSGNTGIGIYALWNNQTGHSNVAVGTQALLNSGNRSNLVAIGDSALLKNGFGATQSSHATANTAVGSKALASNTIGEQNTATGSDALRFNVSGSRNTATGRSALYSNIAGSGNSAFGTGSLVNNTTGDNNTVTGFSSMQNNTTGSNNTASGWAVLNGNADGNGNTAYGTGALFSNSSGNSNTAVGLNALNANVIGSENTALGFATTVWFSDMTNATAIGARAAVQCSNCMVLGSVNGVNGGTSNVNVGIGTINPTRPLSFPPSLGEKILLYPGGAGEVGIGVYGNELRLHADNPGSSVSFGTQDNAGVFTQAGRFQISGGYALFVNGNIWANGTTYASDARFKENITTIESPLQKILQINGVEYEMSVDEFSQNHFMPGRQIGLLAQNVEKVIPEAVHEKDGYKGVDYAKLVPLLIEGIKEQQKQIDELKKMVETLSKK